MEMELMKKRVEEKKEWNRSDTHGISSRQPPVCSTTKSAISSRSGPTQTTHISIQTRPTVATPPLREFSCVFPLFIDIADPVFAVFLS